MGSNHVVAVVEFAGGRIVVDVPSSVTAMASNVGLLKTTDNFVSFFCWLKGGGELNRITNRQPTSFYLLPENVEIFPRIFSLFVKNRKSARP